MFVYNLLVCFQGFRALVRYHQDYQALGSPPAPAPEQQYKIDLPSADNVLLPFCRPFVHSSLRY
jgi:hypothetical protein